jgi:hypothetical protein
VKLPIHSNGNANEFEFMMVSSQLQPRIFAIADVTSTVSPEMSVQLLNIWTAVED